MVRLEDLANEIGEEFVRVRLLQFLCDDGVAKDFLDDLHVLSFDLEEIWVIAFYVEVVEEANEVLDVLVFLEELVEDGAVYHVVYYANIEVLALGFVGVVYF